MLAKLCFLALKMEPGSRDLLDPFGKQKNTLKIYSKQHMRRLVKAAIEEKSSKINNELLRFSQEMRPQPNIQMNLLCSQQNGDIVPLDLPTCQGLVKAAVEEQSDKINDQLPEFSQQMTSQNVEVVPLELATCHIKCNQNLNEGNALDVDSCLNSPNLHKEKRNITKELVRDWATKHAVTHSSINDLLKVFRLDYPEFPKDARTLLKTECHYIMKKLLKGEYHHFGLLNGIKKQIQKEIPSSTTIRISIGIDGLPLFKSSSTEFWPILGLIFSLPNASVFIIGLYCGTGKPLLIDDFLFDFVEEAKQLSSLGFFFNGKQFSVQIGPFICDAPARAFVKCIKSHNGYHGCDKCVEEGTWNDRIVLIEQGCMLRTDE